MKRIITSFLLLVLCSMATWAAKETKGLKLNGVDQYMSIPNDAAFFPAKGGDYTVTAMLKLSEFNPNKNARFIANRAYTGSTSDQTTTGYEIWGGHAIDEFVSCNTSLTGSPWGHNNHWTTAYGALGRYVHVAWVLNGKQRTSTLYVDGMAADEFYDRGNSANFAISEWGNHGYDVLIGAGYKAPKDESGKITGAAVVDYFAQVEIDNVHFYNRALSENDVIGDMTAFDAQSAQHLVAAYDFENVVGNIVPDISNQGHDGQLHGFAAPEPVAPEYAIPQGDDNLRQKSENGQLQDRSKERLIYQLQVNGATYLDQPVIFTSTVNPMNGAQREVYVDKTNEKVDMTAGDDILIEMSHNIQWMHSYLYIDYDNDGVFNEENELVAYSFYSSTDTEDGVNSLGEPRKNNCGVALPRFVVDPKAEEMETRMRLKIDWNSTNPVGNPSQSIGGNAGTIVDYTVYLHKGKPAKHAVTYNPVCEGGSFKVMNGSDEITSGTGVDEGSVLTIVPTADKGFFFAGYILNPGTENEEPVEGPFEGPITFVVNGPTELLGFFDLQQYTVHLSQPENGTLKVTSLEMGELEEGSTVVYGDELTLEATPAEGYQLVAYLVNGVAQTENQVIVEGDVTLSATFALSAVEPEYTQPSATRAGNIRSLDVITIAGATLNGEAQTYTHKLPAGYKAVYQDATAKVLDLTEGDNISFSWTTPAGQEIRWMMHYLYIDYNHNGSFDDEGELVAFTYVKDEDGTVRSSEKVIENPEHYWGGTNYLDHPFVNIPDFVVKSLAKDVTTRMRYKCEWENTSGDHINEGIGANGGTVVDFTVNLHQKVEKKYTVTFNNKVDGGFFRVYETNTMRVLQSGDQVVEGTELTVDAATLDGYYVRNVLVNGVPAQNVNGVWRFYVTADTDIQVVFSDKFLVQFDPAPQYGKVQLYSQNGAVEPTEVQPGDEIQLGANVTVQLIPEDGCEVESFMVNGEDHKSDLVANDMNNLQNKTWKQRSVTYDLNIEVKFREKVKPHQVNFNVTDGGDLYVVDERDTFIYSGDHVAHKTTLKCTIEPKKHYELVSLQINGEEKMADVVKDQDVYTYNFVVLEDIDMSVTFMLPEGIGDVRLLDAAQYHATTQTLYVPAGAHATVYNAAGQPVMGVTGEATLSAASWATGTYLVRIVNGSQVKVLKFIKK